MATLNDYLLVSGLLFAIGLAGVVLRRNIIIDLHVPRAHAQRRQPHAWSPSPASTTVNGLPDYNGQMLVFFVITVAAAEVAVGLAIIVALYRARQTIHTDDLDLA